MMRLNLPVKPTNIIAACLANDVLYIKVLQLPIGTSLRIHIAIHKQANIFYIWCNGKRLWVKHIAYIT